MNCIQLDLQEGKGRSLKPFQVGQIKLRNFLSCSSLAMPSHKEVNAKACDRLLLKLLLSFVFILVFLFFRVGFLLFLLFCMLSGPKSVQFIISNFYSGQLQILSSYEDICRVHLGDCVTLK